MLKIHHHFGLPEYTHASHRLELSPVAPDQDELIESIDTERANDKIELENTPDVRQLDAFWTGVESDLKKDPDWFDFAED